MTNDFHLFGDDADPSLDGDVALISAYIARELSVVQILAMEDRLATDSAFRKTMQQIVDGWVVTAGSASTRGRRAAGTSITAAEIEAGWQRHLASVGSPGTELEFAL